MPLVVRQHTYVSGALIIASQNNTNEDTLYNLVNGNLDADNISSILEANITFNTTTGHDHDGSNSRTIDISGAGYLLKCVTTGTNDAIIGGSTSAGPHAGISGYATTATGYGGYFNHFSIGTSVFIDCTGGGNPCTIQNANGVAGDSALKIAHRSTTANKAGLEITAANVNGYGILVQPVPNWGIRVNMDNTSGLGTGGVNIRDTSTIATIPLYIQKTSASSLNPALWVTSASTATYAAFLGGALYGVHVDANPTDTNGPTGGNAASQWALKVTGSGGVNDNALFVDGYSLFDGNVNVTGDLNIGGTLSKGGGSFKIDHPLQPEKKILRHSFVESPDMKNVYDGVVEVNAVGKATVQLPDYFLALNKDFRYQLTGFGPGNCWIRSEIDDETGRFEIQSSCPHQKVWWQVTGIRIDKYALAHPIVVEEDKETPGYLHPEVW